MSLQLEPHAGLGTGSARSPYSPSKETEQTYVDQWPLGTCRDAWERGLDKEREGRGNDVPAAESRGASFAAPLPE